MLAAELRYTGAVLSVLAVIAFAFTSAVALGRYVPLTFGLFLAMCL